MFKVLYAPFEGVAFERFQPRSRSKAVLAYAGPKGARVLISTVKTGDASDLLEAVAEDLNGSPSVEFTKLMLRSIKDVWQVWKRDHETNLTRALRFESMFRLRERQPPFAPNNGERVDGYW